MRFWDFPVDLMSHDQINEQSSRWSHLGRKSDEIWCDFDWIQRVEKQWDSSIKDFRELHSCENGRQKVQNDEKWSKSVLRSSQMEFGCRLIGSTEMFYQPRDRKWPKMVENAVLRVFWANGPGNLTYSTKSDIKNTKNRKIAKNDEKWVFW